MTNETVPTRKKGVKDYLRFVFFPFVWLRRQYYWKWCPKHNPKKLAAFIYKNLTGEKLDWDNPRDLNAKINWLKFHGDRALWARCADKYAVRQYVEERGCGDLLVKLYGKWDRAEDIDWDSLPEKFILKMNNGSGGNYICRDKSQLHIPEVTKRFKRWVEMDYSDMFAEPHYSDIKPCIIAEELLDSSCQDIKSDSLVDYKIWSFNGKPLYIWVCHNRNAKGAQVATYDTEWNFRPEKSKYTECFSESTISIPKPKCLDVMLEAASKLSVGHPQVRVDLYVVNDKCYFGEMTFTSLGGYMNFYSKEMLNEMGDYTDLSIVNNKKQK